MYAQHFGLRHEPFSIAPDPRYLFMSEQHREALAHLLYGVNGGGGFVLLTGEVGAGKTTVCRCFLEQIPKRCNVAYIFNPKLTVGELLKSICEEFRVPIEQQAYGTPGNPGAPTVKDYLDPLNEFLLATHAVGQNSVLIIDEAQNLSSDVLEQLRLLTNLETSERKLLQIILIGQPELRDLLARPELTQLAQRVIARFHLEALTEPETMRYIRHRLSVAGQSSHRPFERKAMRRIYKLSGGIPRRINLLADRALLGAYATGSARANTEIVDKAAGEVFGRAELARLALARFPQWAVMTGGVLVGAVLVGLAVWLVGGSSRRDAEPASASAASAATSATAGNAAPANAAVARTDPAPRAGSPASAAITTATTGVNPATQTSPNPASPATTGALKVPDTAPGLALAAATTAAIAAPATPASAAAAAAPAAAASALAAASATSLLRDQRQAWQELARLWSLPPNLDDPCRAALQQQVQCFRGTTTLELIRLLDRPAILTLTDASERPVYAVLTGLSDKSATLKMGATGSVSQTISLVSLTRMWHGEFATMWRAPSGYAGLLQQGASGPAVQHLATQLATVQGTQPPSGPLAFDAEVKSRVNAFQQAHGLKPDGVAGPTTFMLLNRATGVAEPRLETGA